MKTPEELRELADKWGAIDQAERDRQWTALGPEQQEEFKAILDQAKAGPTETTASIADAPMSATEGKKKWSLAKMGLVGCAGLAILAVLRGGLVSSRA